VTASATIDVRVDAPAGPIVGVRDGAEDVAAFLGIRYAQAPVGGLRWRPPVRTGRWEEPFRADRLSARCPQPEIGDLPSIRSRTFLNGAEREDEDCLFLNVWTAAPSSRERRPVMVWIHGGGYRSGFSCTPATNGAALARLGVVVVSLNYRVGKFGFLAHPELSAESASGTSGNYGLLDQIAALEWVRGNIGAFGGDPDCVTIFGQSAGSSSVSYLMISPLAAGLFARAIGESGAAFGPVLATPSEGFTIQRLADAESYGERFTGMLGVASIGELRNVPARTIVDAPTGRFESSWPIIDGYVMPDDPVRLFRERRYHDVPLLTGSNADEGTLYAAATSADAFVAAARARFGALAAEYVRLYPAATDREAYRSSEETTRDQVFAWQNWTWARLQREYGSAPAYAYRFEHVPPLPESTVFIERPASRDLRSFHGGEIAYVFGNLHDDWPWQAHDRHLGQVMSQYWVNFARTGDPNGDGLPPWPQFAAHDETMIFGANIASAPMPNQARFAFWDRFFDLAAR
jgi:para-nitrobenzyl esterase